MKNRLYLTVIIVLLLVFCTACKSRDDSSDTNDSVIDYYQVHSLDSDLTFDELVEYLTDKLGVEYYDPFETGSYRYEEDNAQLISDYSRFLEKRLQDEIKYNDPGIVEAYEYHVNKMYSCVYDKWTQIVMYQFDSRALAHMYYSDRAEYWVYGADKYSDRDLLMNSIETGTFLELNKHGFFCARYYIGDIYVSLSIHISVCGADPYMEFLEIADDLDLPVSDEISEAIMNAE